MVVETRQRPLRGAEAKAAFARVHTRTKGLVRIAAEEASLERKLTTTDGQERPTKTEYRQALLDTVTQRLGEEGRLPAPVEPVSTGTEIASSARKRLVDAAGKAGRKTKDALANGHLGQQLIAEAVAQALTAGSVLGYKNIVLRSYLNRIDHEAVYGTPRTMRRFRKGLMHAVELVPVVGDGINGFGALFGRHNVVGRKLDAPGRIIEALGVIPALNATLLHDARVRVEEKVVQRLQNRARSGQSPTAK